MLSQGMTFSEQFSPLYFPVGAVSADEVVILGNNGHLFLYKGSNNLIELYAMDESKARSLADQWIALNAQRAKKCQDFDIPFMTFVIPEKSTVLPEYFPVRTDKIIPIYKILESTASPNYLQSLTALLNHPLRAQTYPKTDSHLSMIGTYTIFRNYISAVFPECSQLFDNITYEALLAKEGKMRAGPLSEKLYGIPAFEEFALLAPGLFESSQTAEEIEKIEAPNNGFVGTKIIWKNSSAPINKKIVAFGNSFFERGASPQGFSWWFKTFFSEFHFIWRPEMDFDYIEKVQPSAVVFQTIERFLRVVPQQ